jgi:PmbA protein
LEEKLIQIGSWAVEHARAIGVEAESFLLHSEDLTVEVIDGQVETLKESEEMGLGVRVLQHNKLGFAFTTDLSQSAVKEAIDKACDGARYAGDDRFNGLPAAAGGYPDLKIFDQAIKTSPLEAKIEMAREVERQAKSRDHRITVIERAGYEDSIYSVAVVSSQGVKAFHKAAYCGLYVFLVAEENGDAQTGFSTEARRKIAELNPAQVGAEGANSALRSLGAKNIPSRPLPCILEPYVMTNFLGVLSESFSADSVQKGKSILQGRLGQTIASSLVTLIDDGTYEAGVSSFPFDGEGWPSQRTVLIEGGVLKSFLYDTYTARKDQVNSTGNGARGSFRGLPSVGISNLMVQPGPHSPDQLWEDIERGVYITEVMGMHTANPISGDFSVGASGILIEKGKMSYPVRGITIAGNLYGFLKDIEGVANDLRFFGAIGSPTVRVKSLSIAGE